MTKIARIIKDAFATIAAAVLWGLFCAFIIPIVTFIEATVNFIEGVNERRRRHES